MPLSWSDLARRTWREVIDDDVLGLAAQLSYYFFLALFPAILFLLSRYGRLLGPVPDRRPPCSGRNGQRLIKTVPRRGYIFQAEVTVSKLVNHRLCAVGDVERGEVTVEGAARTEETAELLIDASAAGRAVTVTRLAVLPFRLLKADANIAFLSYSLVDAITSSLAGFQSLVVCSSFATMRYGMEQALDVRRVAGELGVDLVLTGTLMSVADVFASASS